jgi:hypothetical protein
VLPRVKTIVHQKQYTDDELLADAEVVEYQLKVAMDTLSSYDEYVAEVGLQGWCSCAV